MPPRSAECWSRDDLPTDSRCRALASTLRRLAARAELGETHEEVAEALERVGFDEVVRDAGVSAGDRRLVCWPLALTLARLFPATNKRRRLRGAHVVELLGSHQAPQALLDALRDLASLERSTRDSLLCALAECTAVSALFFDCEKEDDEGIAVLAKDLARHVNHLSGCVFRARRPAQTRFFENELARPFI